MLYWPQMHPDIHRPEVRVGLWQKQHLTLLRQAPTACGTINPDVDTPFVFLQNRHNNVMKENWRPALQFWFSFILPNETI
jgi:hypothetical protein